MPPGPIFFATNKQSCMVTFVQKNQLSMPGILIAGIGHGGTAGRPHVTLLNGRVSGLHGYLLTNWIPDRGGASGMEAAQCNPVEVFFLCLHWGFYSTDAYRTGSIAPGPRPYKQRRLWTEQLPRRTSNWESLSSTTWASHGRNAQAHGALRGARKRRTDHHGSDAMNRARSAVLSDFSTVDSGGGRRIVPVIAPGRMVEVDNGIAVP